MESKPTTRVLMPVAFTLALVMIWQGSQTLQVKVTAHTVVGGEQTIIVVSFPDRRSRD